MAILTRNNILAEIEAGHLRFTPPLDSFQLQPHAVDLRLGFTFLVPRYWTLTQEGRVATHLDHLKGGSAHFDTVELEPGQVFDLLPAEWVLVSTLETIAMPNNLVGNMFPRSSVNRQGLAIDLSGIIDAGYEGPLVVPVRNNHATNVVRIYPGERFCQVTFTLLESPVEIRKSRYHQRDITAGVLQEQNADELDLIRRGDIEQLKRTHGL